MKLYMFRTVPPSIIRSYSLYTQQWYMSYRFVDSCTLVDHEKLLLESCLQTCTTYTIAVCTVNNSWWWTEELSETCRVSFQNKFEKLVHLVGFIIRKFVTKHGHMNVKLLSTVSQFHAYFRYTVCTLVLIRLVLKLLKKITSTSWLLLG
jgi:hypothetical protein